MKTSATQPRPIHARVVRASLPTSGPAAPSVQDARAEVSSSSITEPSMTVHESPDATLAKNLVVARRAADVTQHELAARALISRATVAQIETGYSDPRLSTIVDLARALGVPPYFLLIGVEEVNALVAMPAALSERPLEVPPGELDRMRRLIRSGMLKDRIRAARIGEGVAHDAGRQTQAARVAAAIFSAIQPGTGTAVGTVLGELAATPKR